MKALANLLLPNIVILLLELVKGVYGKLKLGYLNKRLGSFEHKDDIYILGNGPSLKNTLDRDLDILKNKECAVVNKFGNTDYFFHIKPSWYILADPAFFLDFNKIPDSIKKEIVPLSQVIKKKVTWRMNFYIPIVAEKREFIKEIGMNPNICFYYYNNYGVSDVIPDGTFKYKLWDYNLLSPLSQTVLNTAVHLGIKLRYSKIYLLGADTSWHENYELDQKTNVLYSIDTHFYGKRKLPLYLDSEETLPSKLHLELSMVAKALGSYWTLLEYSKYAHVNIYNASEYSWIDAFPRSTISDCKQKNV